jgi:hypothetical protein
MTRSCFRSHLQKNPVHIPSSPSCFQPKHWVDRSLDIEEEVVVEGRLLVFADQVLTWQGFHYKVFRDDSCGFDNGRLE